MKKKQSASGIFFSMFLRAIVVILAIVIVCLVVALIRSLIHGGKTDSTSSGVSASTTASKDEDDELLTAKATEAKTEAASTEVKLDVRIAVLNGTNTNGVAGAWREKLNNAGYTSVEAGNYSGTTTTTLIYYKTAGAGQELAANFTEPQVIETFDSSNTDINLDNIDVLIIIGAKDDIVSN